MLDIHLYLIFAAIIIFVTIIDSYLNRNDQIIGIKKALGLSLMWIVAAFIFNFIIWEARGEELAMQFFTAFLIEKSLSVDNLFVFIIIFSYFNVPAEFQHRALFWGIFGALVIRGVFIVAGVEIINKFEWATYILGALLIYTGIKLLLHDENEKIAPEKNFFLKIFKKYFPTTNRFHGHDFFVKENGTWFATPLFVVLIVIESTDVLFAVDSVPAVIAISKDPLIVYTSNIFAIFGLRALYFALAGVMKFFTFLNYGLAIILSFVGLKMIIENLHLFHIPVTATLYFVVIVLLGSIALSLLFGKKEK